MENACMQTESGSLTDRRERTSVHPKFSLSKDTQRARNVGRHRTFRTDPTVARTLPKSLYKPSVTGTFGHSASLPPRHHVSYRYMAHGYQDFDVV